MLYTSRSMTRHQPVANDLSQVVDFFCEFLISKFMLIGTWKSEMYPFIIWNIAYLPRITLVASNMPIADGF